MFKGRTHAHGLIGRSQGKPPVIGKQHRVPFLCKPQMNPQPHPPIPTPTKE